MKIYTTEGKWGKVNDYTIDYAMSSFVIEVAGDKKSGYLIVIKNFHTSETLDWDDTRQIKDLRKAKIFGLTMLKGLLSNMESKIEKDIHELIRGQK